MLARVQFNAAPSIFLDIRNALSHEGSWAPGHYVCYTLISLYSLDGLQITVERRLFLRGFISLPNEIIQTGRHYGSIH